MSDTLVNSVKKAFGILDILVFEDHESKGLGLFELSRKTAIKPNTLRNLLKTMIACGYVKQDEQSKYLAGPKCANIGVLNRLLPGTAALSWMEELLGQLSEKIAETVIFTVLSDGNRIRLINAEQVHPVKVDFKVLENEHIYLKTTGRVLTAWADNYSLQRILNRWGMPGDKWNQITSINALQRELERIRRQGFCLAYVRMAVPVFTHEGKLLGAMGSYAPAYRCPEEKQKMIIREMKLIAARIAVEL